MAKNEDRSAVEPAIERELEARRRRIAAAEAPFRSPSLDEIGRRLSRLLAANLPAGFSVHDLQPLTGGASKQHFVFELEEGGRRRSLVLRTALGECLGTPPNFRRESEIQSALRGRVPVPGVAFVDADGEHFEAPAIVLERVAGVTAPPESAGRPSGLGMIFPPKRRPAISTAFLENLVGIHRFADAAESRALVSFARPAAGTREAADGVIAWWRRVWEDDALEDHPMVQVAFDWLEENAPPTESISLLHGDYRSGNFLFDPDTDTVTAVLDWELARFGDRHEDLGWTLSTINGAFDDDGTWLVCGLEPRASFLERYERLIGLPVDPERVFFYELLSELKVVVIALGIGPRNADSRLAHAHLANLVFSPLGWRSLARLRDMLSTVEGKTGKEL